MSPTYRGSRVSYQAKSHFAQRYTFDYHPEDVYFCTADCGWITGHSYVTYGPMLNTATQATGIAFRAQGFGSPIGPEF